MKGRGHFARHSTIIITSDLFSVPYGYARPYTPICQDNGNIEICNVADEGEEELNFCIDGNISESDY